MPRKAYLADLKSAKSTSIPNITAVEPGANTGTFSFLYQSQHLSEGSVIIQGEVPEVSDYPIEHDCFLFINPDQNPPPVIPNTLVCISGDVKGKTLLQTLKIIASSLERALDPAAPIEISDSDEGYDGGDFDDDDDDDEMFSGEPCATAKIVYNSSNTLKKTAAEIITAKRIRSDLRAVKRAGFKVGILGDLRRTCIVCCSIRVTKLGISEEAMKAWGLRRKQYLVLMIRFLDGYQAIEQVQNEMTLSSRTQIRVGLCERYKPSLEDATNIFAHVSTLNDTAHKQKPQPLQVDTAAASSTKSPLEPLFIGAPINELFRDRFAQILKYRLACAFPWPGAELFYNDVQGKNMADINIGDPRYLGQEDTRGHTLPQIVIADTVEETSSGLSLSLPLVAMQFLLRHFVRCTEFCLVCHCRVPDFVEALRPYVCSKPLCLYQYMSLGFGPSISWEIITQPYVIDVLVSFCYLSACNGRLKDFPTGIAIKVPLLPQLANTHPDPYAYRPHRQADTMSNGSTDVELRYEKSFSARLDRVNSELLVEPCRFSPVRAGDWLAVQGAALDGSIHYRVVDSSLFPTVRLDGQGIFVSNHQPQSQSSSTNSSVDPTQTQGVPQAGYINVDVFLYDKSFDDLPVTQKRNCVTLLLDTLPSILKLRGHLLASTQGPEPQLRTRQHDLSDSALNVLRWIIASNRSCIMQVDTLSEQHAHMTNSKFTLGVAEDHVTGMPDYLQFRFAMGAPDKEQRFVNCVNEVAARIKTEHPTIFAWHGSPIANWHSIVREGLHFNDTMHGRAYGNGVYMSPHASTSLGYSSMYPSAGNAGSWPNSELKISSAISLNEVVNSPEEFVSQAPHYVVAQLDWIQTRYLFVKTAMASQAKSTDPVISYQQDPARAAYGVTQGPVVIPITAVSKSRRAAVNIKPIPAGKKKVKTIGLTNLQTAEDAQDDADSVVSDLADREYLDSDMEEEVPPAVLKEISNGRKRPRNPVDTASSRVADLSLMTDFVPGALDISSIKMLKEPSYATTQASKTLNKRLQELVKIQKSTPLHQLGWYIDTEKIENMYQWLVELHTFDKDLPLSNDMKKAGISSIILEMRFTSDFPFSPPFVRVVRPRFATFMSGGGGHVTAGGAICMELLTNSGWLVTNTIESLLLQIRMALSSTDPKPARLENGGTRHGRGDSYGAGEAIEAYKRACMTHNWAIPKDFDSLQKE